MPPENLRHKKFIECRYKIEILLRVNTVQQIDTAAISQRDIRGIFKLEGDRDILGGAVFLK